MKVAVSSTGRGLKSAINPVFGRCPWFVIAEIEGGKIKTHRDVENIAAMQMGGAGITAAQIVGNEGVGAVVSCAIGPRAFAVFQQLGIEMYLGESGTVEENITKLSEGKLKKLTQSGPMGGGMGMGFGCGGHHGGRGRRFR